MGRCTRTIGERRLGRTIRKLGNSVELSGAECKAKMSEIKYKRSVQGSIGYTEDSPVQNLRDVAKQKKEQEKNSQ
jgi:hypothetical protein